MDGFETIGWPKRWQLSRFCRGRGIKLLVTCHQDMGFDHRFDTSTSPELLKRIAFHLLGQWSEEYRVGPTFVHQLAISLPDFSGISNNHGGNLREALFSLYDWFEAKRPMHSGGTAGTTENTETIGTEASKLPVLRG